MWSAWSEDGGSRRGGDAIGDRGTSGGSAILAAAIVPPVLLVALVQFAKGGYLLAYLPAAVIALLLPLAALNRTSRRRVGAPRRAWLVVTSLGVVLVAGHSGPSGSWTATGCSPSNWFGLADGVWLVQPRYQAPYADTRPAIRAADAIDTALRSLGPSVRSGRDVVVFDTVDGGANIYRNAGWALPGDRIALIAPGPVLYNQLHGALYYASGDTVAVGPSGSVLLVASPALPGLASLIAQGQARPVSPRQPIGDYRVFRIRPRSRRPRRPCRGPGRSPPAGHGDLSDEPA